MTHPKPSFPPHSDVLAVFQKELARAAALPQASPQLWPRYAGYYRALARLPRRARRALQRQWRRPLAAITLLLALGQAPTIAATLTVASAVAPDVNPDGSCSLIEAIENANADARNHPDCPSGSGADTIALPEYSPQTLTALHNSAPVSGPNGLPAITSVITIEGNGSTIMREGTDPDRFRIFLVNGTGNLTLNETIVSGGVGRSGIDETGMGGGIAVFDGGALTLTNSTVSGNSANDSGGGVFNGGTAILTNSTVSGNTISFRAPTTGPVDAGGGVYNGGTATLTNSTVSGNSARVGGGVSNGGSLTLANSTVSGNSAGEEGGGVSNGGTATITNSTVSGNSAGRSGGGLVNSGTVILSRTLVSGNTATRLMEIDNAAASTFIPNDFNLFGHSGVSNAQAFSGFTPGATDLTATSDGDAPKALGAILDTILADNGGTTKTHALFTGSPAVDAVEAGCPPPATDQRGISRAQTLCDIGAVEGAIPRTADLAIGLTDAPDPVSRDGQLLYTFTVRNDGPAAATGVQVTDRLPEGMVFTSSQGECGGTQTVICELGTLASGAETSVTIHVIPTATGTFTNTATVASNRPDPNPTNNAATETTMVQPRPPTPADMAVTVTATPDPGAAGQALTYTLVVTNNGPDSATGVTLIDDLPAGVGLGQITTSQGNCSGNDPVLCDLGELLLRAQATVTIDVIPTVAGTLSNRATVNLNETDPDSANNSAETTTTVNDPLVPATPQATCGTVRCALRLVCNLSVSLGEDCVQEVTLLVRARDARLSGDAASARAPSRIRFAAAVTNVPPGQSLPVKLRLTKKGKDIAKKKKGKRLKGFLEIRNLAATVTNTPVTIRLK